MKRGVPEEKPTTTKPVGYLLIHMVKRKAGLGATLVKLSRVKRVL
jgi:hypothetical protein